jgi:hypothetical protein
MAGIIHRGSPEHEAHLKGVEMEKSAAKPVVPPRKGSDKSDDKKPEKTETN